MGEKDIKVILTAPVYMQTEALQAFRFAYHNSDFSHGFACISISDRNWIVKKNKAGYSVMISEPAQ